LTDVYGETYVVAVYFDQLERQPNRNNSNVSNLDGKVSVESVDENWALMYGYIGLNGVPVSDD